MQHQKFDISRGRTLKWSISPPGPFIPLCFLPLFFVFTLFSTVPPSVSYLLFTLALLFFSSSSGSLLLPSALLLSVNSPFPFNLLCSPLSFFCFPLLNLKLVTVEDPQGRTSHLCLSKQNLMVIPTNRFQKTASSKGYLTWANRTT